MVSVNPGLGDPRILNWLGSLSLILHPLILEFLENSGNLDMYPDKIFFPQHLDLDKVLVTHPPSEEQMA